MNTIYVQTHPINNTMVYRLSLKYNYNPYTKNNLIMCIILHYDMPSDVIKKLAMYLNSSGYNYFLESNKLVYNMEIIYAIKPFLDSQNIKHTIKHVSKL